MTYRCLAKSVLTHLCLPLLIKLWFYGCNNRQTEEQTTTKENNAPPLPATKRRNNKFDDEKQCKNKIIGQSQRDYMDQYRSIISEVEGAARFVRTQERCRVSCFSCWTSKDPCLICFTLCFNQKAMVVVVTVILTIAHIPIKCCSHAT